jgi:hypothetical protein
MKKRYKYQGENTQALNRSGDRPLNKTHLNKYEMDDLFLFTPVEEKRYI